MSSKPIHTTPWAKGRVFLKLRTVVYILTIVCYRFLISELFYNEISRIRRGCSILIGHGFILIAYDEWLFKC
jgi:hypothetical protein